MESLGKIVNSLSSALDFNQATLSGSVDIVCVKQPDGTIKSTPFHARFGKFKILKSKDKIVKINVNGIQAPFVMKLGEAGEAFFQEEVKVGAGPGSRIEYTVQEKILLSDADLADKINEIQGQNRVPKKSHDSLRMRVIQSSAMQIEDNESTVDLLRVKSNKSNAMDLEPQIPALKAVRSALTLQHVNSAPSIGGDKKQQKALKVRTLRPTSDQLKILNLKHGMNTITYTVESSLQGTQSLTSHIFYWPHDANIIVSDIDGTITKTDFMGHMMAYFGKDWSQPGIAPLFQNIRKNGYYILYLTSRAIGQAEQTKAFLSSIYQDGKMLPQGPLIMSPDRMLSSVKRELLFKRPEIFKMAVLKDIRSLFPADHNPFHAGFGNRETDAIAYRSVGISLDKVFIVNPKGDIHHHSHHDNVMKSYALINTMLKDIFPGIIKEIPVPEANIIRLDSETDMQVNVEKIVN